MNVNFFNTNINKEGIDIVNQVLKSRFISAGRIADEFEKQLVNKLGFLNPVSLNSGTSALHLGLIASGVVKGDEVIIPAQTFIATGLAVLMTGAIPVFADIELNTGNIDPLSIKERITPKTKVIIPVHWAGYPCNLHEINHIANQNNISVIEDAAHAIGAIYKGRPIGTISRFTAFSFQAIKHLTTGDGGALCCVNKSDYYNVKKLRWFDIDRDNSKINDLGERDYNAKQVGYKYHMNDIAAGLGLGNLLSIESILAHHREVAEIYYFGLRNFPGIELPRYENDIVSSYWFYPLLVEKRLAFIKYMKQNDIPVSVVHQRIDKNMIFGGINDLPNQALYNNKNINLPVHMGISLDFASKIVSIIKKGW